MNDHPIRFIVGPTAVGKSEVAFALARQIGAEIIACDSMQVYRQIAIASDKPDQKTCQELPHHCLDIADVSEEFNVSRYRRAAIEAIDDIDRRGRPIVFCGGSGMYMSILLDGIMEQLSRNPVLREQLQKRAIVEGVDALHRQLAELDPEAAARIHPHDAKRIIRALEVCLNSGTTMSEMQIKRQGIWGTRPIEITVLDRPRDILYERIERRIDAMFDKGLVEEIRSVIGNPLSTTAGVLIGIREVGGYLKGDYDLAQARYLMKLNTRHYAKRQLTWFRREKRAVWMDINAKSASQAVERILTKG